MQIWSDLAETCTRDSVQGYTNSVSRIFEKFKFLQKRETPKVFMFGPTLTSFFPLKMAEIEISSVNSAIGLSKYVNGKAVSSPPFQWKIGLLFAFFERFLEKIWAWLKVRGQESKFDLPYWGLKIPGHVAVKKVRSQLFRVLRL